MSRAARYLSGFACIARPLAADRRAEAVQLEAVGLLPIVPGRVPPGTEEARQGRLGAELMARGLKLSAADALRHPVLLGPAHVR